MSRTEMYAVIGNEVTDYMGFRNANRGAFLLWQWLWAKHVGEPFPFLNDRDLKRLWALTQSDDVPAHHKTCLTLTYDNVMLKREDFAQAVEHIRKWCSESNDPGNWLEQADAIEAAGAEVEAICWNQTSVNANPWEHYPNCKSCGCSCNADSVPYDVTKGTKHWYAGHDSQEAKP